MTVLYKVNSIPVLDTDPSFVEHVQARERIRERIRERESRRESPPSPLRRTIRGDVLRAWRVALAMTQRQASALLGVSVQAVKRLERGHGPPVSPTSAP